jgi:hypothetical protein
MRVSTGVKILTGGVAGLTTLASVANLSDATNPSNNDTILSRTSKIVIGGVEATIAGFAGFGFYKAHQFRNLLNAEQHRNTLQRFNHPLANDLYGKLSNHVGSLNPQDYVHLPFKSRVAIVKAYATEANGMATVLAHAAKKSTLDAAMAVPKVPVLPKAL